ncbi:MAG: hypothetical protein ACKPKO_27190, partial [Candidatus Fonsibacter sp.]
MKQIKFIYSVLLFLYSSNSIRSLSTFSSSGKAISDNSTRKTFATASASNHALLYMLYHVIYNIIYYYNILWFKNYIYIWK